MLAARSCRPPTIFKILLEAEDYQVLSSQGFAPLLDEQAQERVNRVYHHAFAHFPERLDHQRIAREAGMSPTEFRRLHAAAAG